MTVAQQSNAARPVSVTAARQAWEELPVRIAALVAVGVTIVVLVVGIRAVVQGTNDRRLIREGTRVEANLDWMDGASRAADRNIRRKVRMSYTLPDEPKTSRRQIEGYLSPLGGQISVGDKIPLYIDTNTAEWTDRVDPPSWVRALTVPLLLSPLAVLMIGQMLWQRSRVLRLYRHGAVTTGTVVDVQKSALLPSGRVMKVAVAGGRVLTTSRPNRLGDPLPARGTLVDLIVNDNNRPRRALLSQAYDPR